MTHLKLAKVATLLCSALLLGGLTACGSTRNNLAPTTTPISQDQTSGIKLSVTQGSFVQGGQVSMQLEIDSSVATSASINLLSQSEVVFDRSHFDVQFNAHERLTFQIHAEIKEPGYYTVTAMGQGQAWKQSQTAMVGFNIASSDIAARTTGQTSLGNGGVETLEDHVKNLPEVTDFAFHVAKVKAELTGRKDFRRDFQYKGIQFKKADGTLTNPENMVVGYIPGTGSGKPNPDELEGPANQKIKGRVTTRSWCGASPAKIHVDIKNNNVNGAPTYNLNNFIVRVIDDNGIFSHDQIAAGIFDANGDFAYSQPNCDMFSPFWGDYSPPDTYFLIEARSPNSSTSSYNEGVRA